MGKLNSFVRESVTIPALKMAAREHYLAYEKAVGGMACGRALAEHISNDAVTHKAKFNKIMGKLAELDPNCPSIRL